MSIRTKISGVIGVLWGGFLATASSIRLMQGDYITEAEGYLNIYHARLMLGILLTLAGLYYFFTKDKQSTQEDHNK